MQANRYQILTSFCISRRMSPTAFGQTVEGGTAYDGV